MKEKRVPMSKWLAILILGAIFAVFSACSSGNDKQQKAAPDAEQNAAANVSAFTGEVKQKEGPVLAAPESKPVFLWDFSGDTVYPYDFEQTVLSANDMGGMLKKESDKPSGKIDQKIHGQGQILIKSKGNGTADFVLKDLTISMTMDAGSKEGPTTMEQNMPPVVMQGMKEDGFGSYCNNSQDMLFKMLFPLPTQPLQVGESVDVPAQMPFNAMGSTLTVTGRSRITLTRYLEIDQRTCAELSVNIDISDIDVPAEMPGEYMCSVNGDGFFYFDINKRCFVAGTLALLMKIGVNVPAPQVPIDSKVAPDMPERIKMTMRSDNLMTVTLRK